MQARNRLLEEWYGKVKRGEIKLPRFQRAEAWDTQRIVSMINTIIKNLPLGITLVLDVGEHEAFVSRYLSTAEPDQEGRVLEHLLDGQQRLTALWRVLNNNYDSHTFFVYVPVFADEEERQQGIDDATVVCRARYRQNGLRYPKWCDNPEDCLRRGMIPTQLLRPEDIQEEIDQWIAQATNSRRPVDLDELEAWFNWKKDVSDKIMHLRSTIRNYNLPHLSLPSWTPKDVALDVFINMNTNSKPLSQYDIIVAEVESVLGQSLPDRQRQMLEDYPALGRYGDLSRLILHTSALFQDKPPNQRGALEMDKTLMMNQWDKMAYGLNQMANLLAGEGVFDEQRLPTNAVLWVIAALYSAIPEAGDRRGWCERLLRKYMWRAFLTDRYESSAPTNAYADYVALRAVLLGEKGEEAVPIFDGQEYETAKAGQFAAAAWPKNATILGRAALAITLKLGALDLATEERVGVDNIDNRHYHHIFPDALLEEAGIENSYIAMNCALINDKTNLNIGRKDPLKYLTERYEWADEDVVRYRLSSHLIPLEALAHGGYEHLSDQERTEKVKRDYDAFIQRRAELFERAAEKLCEGQPLSISEFVQITAGQKP